LVGFQYLLTSVNENDNPLNIYDLFSLFVLYIDNDNNFSAHYYERSKNGKPQIKCFSCGWVGDIYDLAGMMNNTNEFIEQYRIVDNIFGGGEFELSEKQREFAKSEGKSGRDMEPVKYVAVPRNRAGHIFRREQIDNCRSYSKFDIIKLGEIKGHWFYDDTEGRIIAVDVRFEYQGKKTVQTFWYDGRRVCSWGVINIIYNLYEAVNCTRPIIIHEGAKCAKIGKSALTNFCSVSYNRGVENADKPDWSVIHWTDRPVYILNDNDEPGIKAAPLICPIPKCLYIPARITTLSKFFHIFRAAFIPGSSLSFRI
jgi:hypothetical protein